MGITNYAINEDYTNKLDWKKARKYWNRDVLRIIQAYNPFGPKHGKPSEFAMVHRLLEKLDSVNFEDVKNYSFALSRMLELMLVCNDFNLVLTLRKEDVIKRRENQMRLKAEREALIQKKLERDEQRDQQLKDAREAWEAEHAQKSFEEKPQEEKEDMEEEKEEKEGKEDGEEEMEKEEEPTEFNEQKWLRDWEKDLSIIEVK